LAKARKQAELIPGRLAVGDVEAAKLSTLDRRWYLQALRIILRAGRNDLVGVVTEAAAAIAILPTGMTHTDHTVEFLASVVFKLVDLRGFRNGADNRADVGKRPVRKESPRGDKLPS